jgi:hypothetical protein
MQLPSSMRDVPAVPMARLATGLAQGVGLCLLYGAAEGGIWPATEPLVFAPLLVIACFVPILVLSGIGNMRLRSLVLWATAAAVLLSALGMHDIHRGAADNEVGIWGVFSRHQNALAIWPSPILMLFAAAGLFIAHSLAVAGDAEQRIIAGYPRYFEAAWKHGVQLALSLVFVGLFWGLLELGAGLFKLINLDFLQRLIGHRWFGLPATTLAFACALHVSDVRAGIVRSIRVLVLTLLSWLLPMMALIVLGFLASLPVTGLAPLWATRFATSLLLTTAAALVVLVNAAYQDGDAEHLPPRVLRYAASAASLMLLPLVATASYALALRVAQHGWTTDRIIAAACLVVAACYALGYAWAVLQRGRWLARIALSNVVTAFVVLGVLIALFTPLADPARLSVASQVARLESGKVPAEKFDFAYLRFDGARYGRAALERLKTTEQGALAADIRRRAVAALEQKNRWQAVRVPPTPEELAAKLTVYPSGHALPASFLAQRWSELERSSSLPPCLTAADAAAKCDVVIADFDGDDRDDIVILGSWRAIVMAEDGHGGWRIAGELQGPTNCAPVKAALLAGRFAVVLRPWRDVEVAGRRLRFIEEAENAPCP